MSPVQKVNQAMLNGFTDRTEKFNCLDNITSNKTFLIVMGLLVVIQVLMTFFGAAILRTAPLTLSEWGVVVRLALVVLAVGMLHKLIFLKKHS